MAFPYSLDSFVDKVYGETVQAAHINTVQASVVAIQTKLGIDSSGVTTSIDYLLKNSAARPGHKHEDGTIVSVAEDKVTGDTYIARKDLGHATQTIANTWTFSDTVTLNKGSGLTALSVPLGNVLLAGASAKLAVGTGSPTHTATVNGGRLHVCGSTLDNNPANSPAAGLNIGAATSGSTTEGRLVVYNSGGSGAGFLSVFTNTGAAVSSEKFRVGPTGQVGCVNAGSFGTPVASGLWLAGSATESRIQTYNSGGLSYLICATNKSSGSPSEKVRIDENGYLSVSNRDASPSYPAGRSGLFLGSSTTNVLGAEVTSSELTSWGHAGAPSVGALIFNVSNNAVVAQAVIMAASGNVNIGTEALVVPQKLNVQGYTHLVATGSLLTATPTANGRGMFLGAGTTGECRVQAYGTGNNYLTFHVNTGGAASTELLRLDYNSRVGFNTAGAPEAVFDFDASGTGSAADRTFMLRRSNNTSGLIFDIERRLTSGASLASDESIVQMRFLGQNDTASYVVGALIKADTSGAWSSTSAPADLHFSTTPVGATSPTTRFSIYKDGLVEVAGTSFRIATSDSPANNATASAGTIRWSTGFLYICVSANSWKRVALTTY